MYRRIVEWLRKTKKKMTYSMQVLYQRIKKDNTDSKCPYCGGKSNLIGFKKMILTLYECKLCGLRFRVPKGYPEGAFEYYNKEYSEEAVNTYPSKKEIEDRSFENYMGNRTSFVKRVLSCKSPKTFLDYGCAWGYRVDWMERKGIEEAIGYEVSNQMAEFGRSNLDVDIYTDLNYLRKKYSSEVDMIYTSHVLEHLEEYSNLFEAFRSLLCPEGYLVIIVPNASDRALASRNLSSWGELVGKSHTAAFTFEFFENVLPEEGFSILCKGKKSHEEIRIVSKLKCEYSS